MKRYSIISTTLKSLNQKNMAQAVFASAVVLIIPSNTWQWEAFCDKQKIRERQRLRSKTDRKEEY